MGMAEIHAMGGPGSGLSARVAGEVRAWAGRLSLSQKEIGRILGVTQGQVSARMRGNMEFSLSDIEKLAEAFGIEPLDLIAPEPAVLRRRQINNAQS